VRTVWEALRDGNAKERLAVIADLVSIVGVSLVGAIAAMFAVEGKLDTSAFFGMAILGLLSISGGAVVLALFFVVSFYIGAIFEEYKTFRLLLLFALWSAFAALTLWAGYYTYEILTHTTFIRR
jgi:uncharacterized membrane protein YqjE